MSWLSDMMYLVKGGANDNGCDWFCDQCEAFMNVQPGFTVARGVWICTKCGCKNDVSDNNVRD